VTHTELLRRLRCVSPDGRSAFCPAHEADGKSHRPSLTISEGKEGRILLRCHRGCSTEQIAAALGCTMADLFPNSGNRTNNGSRQPWITYDYCDEQGQLLFQVVRKPGKKFLQRQPDPQRLGEWIWSLNQPRVRRVLYRLQELIAALATGEPVFVVEGEKDTERLRAEGFAATTNPGGAAESDGKSKWLPEYSEVLRGADVVILPDNDQPGRQHAEQIARALHGVAKSIRVTLLPGLPPKGDVSDWLQAGHTTVELLALAGNTPVYTCVPAEEPRKDAPAPDPNAEEPRKDAPEPDAEEGYTKTLRELQANPALLDEPEAVAPRLAFRKRTTILAALPKKGKSSLLGQAIAAVSNGDVFLGERAAAGRVLLLDIDEPIDDPVHRLTVLYGADPDRVHLFIRRPPPAEILAVLRAKVEELRPDLIGIDSLGKLATGLVRDRFKSDDWTPLIEEVAQLGREFNCAIVILHHTKKSGDEYAESVAIAGGADYILTMTGEKDESDRTISVEGRRSFPTYTLTFDGTRYSLDDGTFQEPPLRERVYAHVVRHPGCTQVDVIDGVQARRGDVSYELERLEHDHLIVDRREDKTHHYWAVTDQPADLGLER
jgi:putative DNA primase/helicase